MVKFLIQRPVAVLLSFSALIIAGLFLMKKIPLSLLPSSDIPQIVIRVDYPNTPATTLEENIIEPIRENLITLNHVKSIESKSDNHTGLIYLDYEYGTKMDLATIEVNEKLDRITNSLPKDMQRPQVMRINTSDIPIIRIQVIPKSDSNYLQVSQLAEKVLRKRIEQLEGVSLVDINGTQTGIISITPDKNALSALGLDESSITSTIQGSNKDLGGLSIKDGQYRYFIKLTNRLETIQDIEQLPVKTKDGTIINLGKLVKIESESEKQVGYHVYNGKQGIVITVQKQNSSRMNELVAKIEEAIIQFRKDYPQIDFSLTQDQSFLLDAGISNLKQDLVIGGILTIILLFLFLGNWVSPTLMSISIPVSLIITFVLFYLFGVSFNIISLSGLALGIGMLIDNSIVVVDNISRKRRSGRNDLESSVEGTNEVITPVISQVLTTVAVYAPLLLLNGMAGSLVFDQSIALTISLGVSLVVAFVLAPLLYMIFLKSSPKKLKEDTDFYNWVSKGYHRMITHILKHKLLYFIITLLIMPIGFLIAPNIPLASLPQIEKKESLIQIDWNLPIDAQENLNRILLLQKYLQHETVITEAEVGIKQFLLQQNNNSIQKAELYYACKNEEAKLRTDTLASNWFLKQYPEGSFRIIDAPNAFTQLFSTKLPYLEVKFKPSSVNYAEGLRNLPEVLKRLPDQRFKIGDGLIEEPAVEVIIDYEKMSVYGISKIAIEETLQQLFGTYTISEIKRFGELKTIRLKTDRLTLQEKLNTSIKGINNASYALSNFISIRFVTQQKYITSDKTGPYKSIIYESGDGKLLEEQASLLGTKYGFTTELSGAVFENRSRIKEMAIIFLLVLGLLFFILAIQYESLLQPLIVMLTIPLGITGAMLMLWITGGTLDVMAAVGFIVILGLIVDDPILKIETLNRLEKEYNLKGYKHDDALLERMIHEAGDICLKPLLMVSLTTSIAMVPVLFVGGIGNDLQKPLAYVIIGGLTIGTFFTTWFIPLAYWYVKKLTRL